MWKKTKIFRLPVVLIILGILPIFSVAICIGKGYAVVSETYSYIIASSAELAVGGECKITIMLKSETGVAIIGKSVTINSSRSSDEITQPEPTDANGQCTGKLSSRYPGTSNITAACEGKTITALFPRDIIRGCWLLDESAGNTVNDISIYKNNGTINTATHTTGKFGRALQFNGTGWIEIPDNDSLDLMGEITISAWVKIDTNAISQWVVGKYTTTDNQRSYGLVASTSENNILFILSPNGEYASAKILSSIDTISIGTWYHLAATYDGSIMKLYINGELEVSLIYTDGIFSGTSPLFIGKYSDAGHIRGIIDEVKVYSRNLTAEEIKQEYESRSIPIKFTGAPPKGALSKYPSIFSPNNDGINDEVTIFFKNDSYEEVKGRIFDLYGFLIKDNLPPESDYYSLKWNGKNDQGNVVKAGIYIYQISVGNKIVNGTIIIAR